MKEEERKRILLTQANELTQSRYDFSLIEKRCLYLIIQEVRKRYIEDNNYEKTVFSDFYLRMNSNALTQAGDKAIDAYNALKKMANRAIEIDNEIEWVYTHWITSAKHAKGSNTYEVGVSREILPYLVELAREFTTYDMTVAISLKSIYSQRFYEICCQYKRRANKSFFLTIKRIREIFMLEDKYPNVNDLRRRVIDLAKKEIKELYDRGQCELYFDFFEKDTDKRKILSYAFFIHTREDEENKVDYCSVAECLKRIHSILSTFFPRDKKFVKKVLTEVQLRPEMAMELTEKLTNKVNDYPKEDIPPIIRFVLREDFDIK